MGRTIQTKRGQRVFKTKDSLLKWVDKESSPRWNSLSDYKAQDRFWVVTKAPVCGLAMVDKQCIQDPDGDDLYRIVYKVDPTGEISEKWGQVRVWSETMLRASEVGSIVDEPIAARLDKWVKSAQEEVEFTHPSGFRDTKVELKPCSIKVPGWKRITKKQQQKNMKEAASVD